MKKNFKFMLVALLAMIGSAVYAAAPAVGGTWTDDNFSYTIATVNLTTKTGTITIAPNGTLSGEVTIPGSVSKKYDDDTYTFIMATIPGNAFKDQVNITKVNFPAELTEIGTSAFSGCTLLAEISFAAGSQLQTIGDYAFATTQIVNPDFSNCEVLGSFTGDIFTDGTNNNSYVETVTFPETAVFTSFSTALARLTNLKSTNIESTQIQTVVANAFNGTSAACAADEGLRALILPATVKSIEETAFQGSLIADLTINVDAINDKDATDPGIGAGTNPIYGTTTGVLTDLTLIGELKGRVAGNAFKGMTALESVDMSAMTFASKGQIETSAFEGCTALEEVTLGDINHNGVTGQYTINDDAFKGCTALATVTIGDIDTQGAIGKEAFGTALTTLTIGDVTKASAIKAEAFKFADATTTVTIGKVFNENPAGTVYVFPADAFTFTASDATNKPVNVTIGDGTKAIDSKGKVFAAGAFAGSYISLLTFDGAIIEKGIDEALVGTTNIYGLDFDGPITTNGILSGTFAGIEAKGCTVINFNGELAPLAVATGAFTVSTAYAAGTTILTVNYTSATHANTTKSGMPFAQAAFHASYTADRDIAINITNAALKATFLANQTEDANDIIFRALLVPADPTNYFIVYGDNNNLGTSYGRILLQKGKIYQIDRRPTSEDADGVDQTGITYTLNVVYKEEDDNSASTTLNMLPMVSNDGFYYVDLTSATSDVVCIIKAKGTEAVADKETKMWYEEIASVPAGKTASNVYNGDGSVKMASAVVTNQQLRDGAGDPKPYTDYYADPQVTTADALTSAILAANNVYLLTNPAAFEGEKAVLIDYANYTTPFINAGNFYALGKKYAAAPGRMVINWIGENEATAIYAVKTGKNVSAEASDAIYNLQGVRVNKAQKGIYIQNGKKIVIK